MSRNVSTPSARYCLIFFFCNKTSLNLIYKQCLCFHLYFLSKQCKILCYNIAVYYQYMSTVKLFNMAHNVNKAEYILIMLIYLTNTPSHRASPSMLTEQSCRAPTERFPPSAQQKLLGGLLGRMLGGTIYERSVETARWALGRNARRRSVGLVVYL